MDHFSPLPQRRTSMPIMTASMHPQLGLGDWRAPRKENVTLKIEIILLQQHFSFVYLYIKYVDVSRVLKDCMNGLPIKNINRIHSRNFFPSEKVHTRSFGQPIVNFLYYINFESVKTKCCEVGL